MKNDDMSDDEFDAFLNGKDDVSRRLQALPQPSSSAQLDAAILQHVQQSLAQENRPEAANDAGGVPAPRLQPGFGYRWRVPAGIAATLLAGVFAHQVFDASRTDKQAAVLSETAEMAPAPVLASPPPPPVQSEVVEAPRHAEQKPAARKPQPAPSMKSVPAAPEAAAPAAPAPAAPAPATAPAERALARPVRGAMDVTAAAAATNQQAAQEMLPDAWLVKIDALLKADSTQEARAEWARFRQAYPEYPVPDELKARLGPDSQ